MKVTTFRMIIIVMSAAILAYMTIRAFVLADANDHDASGVHPLAEKGLHDFLDATDVNAMLNILYQVVPNFMPNDRLSMLAVSRQETNVCDITAVLDKRPFEGVYAKGRLTPSVNNIETLDVRDTSFVEEWVKWMLEQFRDAPYVCLDFKSAPEFYRVFTYNSQTCTAGFLFLTERTSQQYRDSIESRCRLGHTLRGDAIIKVTNNVFIITERR